MHKPPTPARRLRGCAASNLPPKQTRRGRKAFGGAGINRASRWTNRRAYRLRVWVRTTSDFRGLIGAWVTGDARGKTLTRESLNTEGLWCELVIEGIEPKTGDLAVYLNLMDAPGTAWFDDVELTEQK